MRIFKDILKHKLKNYNKLELEYDKMNLDAASASALHIEPLKVMFRQKVKEFNAILNLDYETVIPTFSYYDALNWVNELYPKVNAVINVGNDIIHAVNIRNKLFPDERLEGLSEEELYILRNLQCIE